MIAAIAEKKKVIWKPFSSDRWDRTFYISAIVVAQQPPKLFKDERFGRFSKHRSIVDLQQTLEICTLHVDSANF